jgi:hypothetical protein
MWPELVAMWPELVAMWPELVEGCIALRQTQRTWVAHMASASYTSTVPPDCKTGHLFALLAASASDSALMIE